MSSHSCDAPWVSVLIPNSGTWQVQFPESGQLARGSSLAHLAGTPGPTTEVAHAPVAPTTTWPPLKEET